MCLIIRMGVQEQVSKEKLTIGKVEPVLDIVSALDAYDDRNDIKSAQSTKNNSKIRSTEGSSQYNNMESSDDDEDSVCGEDDITNDAYDSDGVLVGKGKVN